MIGFGARGGVGIPPQYLSVLCSVVARSLVVTLVFSVCDPSHRAVHTFEPFGTPPCWCFVWLRHLSRFQFGEQRLEHLGCMLVSDVLNAFGMELRLTFPNKVIRKRFGRFPTSTWEVAKQAEFSYVGKVRLVYVVFTCARSVWNQAKVSSLRSSLDAWT